jgi:hypothetical protein
VKHYLSGAALAALIAGCSPTFADDAVAQVTTQSVLRLTVTINAPFSISASPAAPQIGCNAAAGTTVTTLTPAGGDNTAVGYALAGDTGDFVMSGNVLVVGANGIASGNCGSTQGVTITASQN